MITRILRCLIWEIQVKCEDILLSFQPKIKGESCLFEDNFHVGNNCRNGGALNNATKASIDNSVNNFIAKKSKLHRDSL